MTGEYPRVSVIIPTYNRANYLSEAVQSVLGQTFCDFEIVLVDDGSTDNTRDVVKAFSDPRLRYMYQPNGGISSAMNTGVRAAHAPYIARLDSDDVWLPDLLQCEVAVLDARPDIGLVYGRARAMNSRGQDVPRIIGVPPRFPNDMLKSILWGDFVCAITTTLRRGCLERVGPFNEQLQGNEDWEMWIRLARHYQFAFIDRILARFRQHEGRFTSAQSRHFVAVTQGRLQLLDEAFSQPDLPREVLALKPMIYRNAHLDVGMRWLGTTNYRDALHQFRKAAQVSHAPVSTAVRIAYLILLTRFLRQYGWGMWATDRLGAVVRRLRALRRPVTPGQVQPG